MVPPNSQPLKVPTPKRVVGELRRAVPQGIAGPRYGRQRQRSVELPATAHSNLPPSIEYEFSRQLGAGAGKDMAAALDRRRGAVQHAHVAARCRGPFRPQPIADGVLVIGYIDDHAAGGTA
jgi:hypothetical protein